jgi:glycosyltransferase involved in cell wall biosynthesis
VKTAHSGNIANNAYLVAKFLRRLGEDAHAFHFRHEFIMGHPEWEDADFEGSLDPFDPPDWRTIPFTNGYVRPDWVHYLSGQVDPYVLPPDAPAGAASRVMAALYVDQSQATTGIFSHVRQILGAVGARYNGLARVNQLTPREALELRVLGGARLLVEWATGFRAEHALFVTPRLRRLIYVRDAINRDSRLHRSGARATMPMLAKAPFWASYRPMTNDYDLVQFYGLEAVKGAFLSPSVPFIAFEHSTMRTLPFENTTQGRLLNLAYRTADACIITNPDVVASARRLGLRNYRFIPHPIDELKYSPLADGQETDIRRELRTATGADLLFLCPTRHEWGNAFDSKRSDRVIRAFAKYVAEPSHPRAALVLCRWGRDVRASEDLIASLGIESSVVWKPPMHKTRLRDYYRSCEIVLDQFHESVGTFGTVTAEGLSCALPVIMHFNPKVHEWCLPEMPPIQSALTEDEIATRLSELATAPDRRRAVGRASREWVIKWHGWERCARDHLDVHTKAVTSHRTQH